MANTQWYASRLRSMSAREIGWRVRRTAGSRFSRLRNHGTDPTPGHTEPGWHDALARFRAADSRPVLLARHRARRIAALQPEMAAEILAAADRAAQLQFAYFGYPAIELPEPVDWNYDPFASVRWPTSPWSKIDYRTAQGDVKWIWELNRLQHLPWLAQAWLITGDERFSKAAFHQLDSWLDQNPSGVGIAWRNAFEAGVRAISIAVAVQGLRDCPELTVDRFRQIVKVLAASATRCCVDRSRFSSANNHLIGEMAGLAVVAILFPDLPQAGDWEQQAITGLTAEADRQILADGAGAEQAVGYQVFTVELMLVVVALLVERDGRAPQPILEAIDRSAAYLAAVVGQADPDPRYGDNDEGFALRLGAEPVRTVRDHLGSVAALTSCLVAQRYGARTWTAEWLGQLRAPEIEPAREIRTALESFGDSHYAPAGGLVVMRAGTRRAVMDVGPLGYLSIAAHGHADALSVTISIDGQEVVGDPGAGSYYGHPDWRRINRGTRVHASVEVDGHDQSVISGAFMWTHHARVRARAVDLESGVVDAEHFGYQRFAQPVTHRRWLVAPHDCAALLVVDLLSGTGRHLVRTSWPLHPSLDVERVSLGHLVTRSGSLIAHIAAAATTALTAEQVRGDECNLLGWWSDRLESREPSWLVGSSCVARLPLVVATVIQPTADGQRVIGLGASHSGAAVEVAWSDPRRSYRASIDTTRFGCVSVHSDLVGS
jgi:Heparinase II/III-like protein/Heparinase II/III N-terminus